ncbi:MAG: hypothetical protein U1B30_15900 [Pseudomonadota bacterium]|nr:hypothetical protein [Pseudomonadota bacterium]
MPKYTFIADPGHGWLQVPLHEVRKLGIADKISACSYMSSNMAYLEEDCDAPLFIKAAGLTQDDISEVHLNHQAPCRGYRPYDSKMVG